MNNIASSKLFFLAGLFTVGTVVGLYFKLEWSYYLALLLFCAVLYLFNKPASNTAERADIKFVLMEILSQETGQEITGLLAEDKQFFLDKLSDLECYRDKTGGMIVMFNFSGKHFSWLVDDSLDFQPIYRNGRQVNSRLWNIHHPHTNELMLNKLSLTRGTKLNADDALESVARAYGTDKSKIVAGVNKAVGVDDNE